jgi:porin
VNNPAIPFPDYGIGLAVYVEPADGWYGAAAIADAQADIREMGLNTAFDREDYTFTIAEGGYVGGLPAPGGTLPGAVRVGLWYDPQPKAGIDGTGSERDDLGFYVSADQVLLHEGGDPASGQGLGVFVRFGWAAADVNAIGTFWSAGCQYRGLVPGRDDDVLGVGMARARVTDEPGSGFTSAHETAVEVYYAVRVAPWLAVTPHVQYVADPGALDAVDDAVILGVRVQAAF